MTTVDDPLLKVIEVDNGFTWTIKFYVGFELIYCINMEHLSGSEINNDVKQLPVYDEDGILLGTVEERLKYVLQS